MRQGRSYAALQAGLGTAEPKPNVAALELKILDLARLVRTAQECQHHSDIFRGLQDQQLAESLHSLQSQVQKLHAAVFESELFLGSRRPSGGGTEASAVTGAMSQTDIPARVDTTVGREDKGTTVLRLAQRDELQSVAKRLEAVEVEVTRAASESRQPERDHEQVIMILERLSALEGCLRDSRAEAGSRCFHTLGEVRRLQGRLEALETRVCGALGWLDGAASNVPQIDVVTDMEKAVAGPTTSVVSGDGGGGSLSDAASPCGECRDVECSGALVAGPEPEADTGCGTQVGRDSGPLVRLLHSTIPHLNTAFTTTCAEEGRAARDQPRHQQNAAEPLQVVEVGRVAGTPPPDPRPAGGHAAETSAVKQSLQQLKLEEEEQAVLLHEKLLQRPPSPLQQLEPRLPQHPLPPPAQEQQLPPGLQLALERSARAATASALEAWETRAAVRAEVEVAHANAIAAEVQRVSRMHLEALLPALERIGTLGPRLEAAIGAMQQHYPVGTGVVALHSGEGVAASLSPLEAAAPAVEAILERPLGRSTSTRLLQSYQLSTETGSLAKDVKGTFPQVATVGRDSGWNARIESGSSCSTMGSGLPDRLHCRQSCAPSLGCATDSKVGSLTYAPQQQPPLPPPHEQPQQQLVLDTSLLAQAVPPMTWCLHPTPGLDSTQPSDLAPPPGSPPAAISLARLSTLTTGSPPAIPATKSPLSLPPMLWDQRLPRPSPDVTASTAACSQGRVAGTTAAAAPPVSGGGGGGGKCLHQPPLGPLREGLLGLAAGLQHSRAQSLSGSLVQQREEVQRMKAQPTLTGSGGMGFLRPPLGLLGGPISKTTALQDGESRAAEAAAAKASFSVSGAGGGSDPEACCGSGGGGGGGIEQLSPMTPFAAVVAGMSVSTLRLDLFPPDDDVLLSSPPAGRPSASQITPLTDTSPVRHRYTTRHRSLGHRGGGGGGSGGCGCGGPGDSAVSGPAPPRGLGPWHPGGAPDLDDSVSRWGWMSDEEEVGQVGAAKSSWLGEWGDREANGRGEGRAAGAAVANQHAGGVRRAVGGRQPAALSLSNGDAKSEPGRRVTSGGGGGSGSILSRIGEVVGRYPHNAGGGAMRSASNTRLDRSSSGGRAAADSTAASSKAVRNNRTVASRRLARAADSPGLDSRRTDISTAAVSPPLKRSVSATTRHRVPYSRSLAATPQHLLDSSCCSSSVGSPGASPWKRRCRRPAGISVCGAEGPTASGLQGEPGPMLGRRRVSGGGSPRTVAVAGAPDSCGRCSTGGGGCVSSRSRGPGSPLWQAVAAAMAGGKGGRPLRGRSSGGASNC